MGNWIFINDGVVEAERGRVDPSDAGLLHGIGLFETLRVFNGKPFRLDAHVRRLLDSADKLKLKLTHSAGQIAAAVRKVIEANSLVEARMRITVTRGPIRMDDEMPAPSTLLVAGTAAVGYPQSYYEQGLAATISSIRINPTDPTAGHKILGYWPRLMMLDAARAMGCGESLWFTLDGRLAEACISNVFLVRDERLVTPPPDTPILPGIVRAAVIEAAGADGIEVEQPGLAATDLFDADEAFLTNSIMGVMPLVLVERRPIGGGKPGPVTVRVAKLYQQLVERESAK